MKNPDSPSHQISSKCERCGASLPAGFLNGLCPACLLLQGVNGETLFETQGGHSFVPPTPEELTEHFPLLDILEFIGKGGMGAVYKARQKELNRVVALKILPPGISDDPAFAQRFIREARALAKMNHPGIVSIYDFGKSGDLFYFVMEYVEGDNLQTLLQSGRISPRQALEIVPQICDALQFAHDQGVVHRDIKPENLLLDKRGRLKIADFGIAKLVDPLAEQIESTSQDNVQHFHTQFHGIVGTPHYMAPEQIANPHQVDHRADIYALGVVFYQMLTGELPAQQLQPPSRKVQIHVSLDEVVLRALEKEPARRYPQASVMKTQVEQAGQASETSHAKKAPWLLVSSITLLLMGAGVYFLRPHVPAIDEQQWVTQGWQQLETGKVSEARASFQKALDDNPDNADAWNGQGWLLFNTGHADEALNAFNKALTLQPEHPGALNGTGQAYLSQGKYAEAEQTLLKAAPTATAAWYGLARLYLIQGQFDQALTWTQKLVDGGIGDATAQKMHEAAQKKVLSDTLKQLITPQT